MKSYMLGSFFPALAARNRVKVLILVDLGKVSIRSITCMTIPAEIAERRG
jgi:hypothetical protein